MAQRRPFEPQRQCELRRCGSGPRVIEIEDFRRTAGEEEIGLERYARGEQRRQQVMHLRHRIARVDVEGRGDRPGAFGHQLFHVG